MRKADANARVKAWIKRGYASIGMSVRYQSEMGNNEQSPEVLILDVDGVMTTGQFFYDERGKAMKVFGPDDNDALSILKPHISIQFVSGDKRGFSISKKRIVDDMGFELDQVSTIRRLDWIKQRYELDKVIYMGDGIFDHYVMRRVKYGIATADADQNAKKYASYVTRRSGGNRAVSEACIHILEKFFTPFNPAEIPANLIKVSGEWTA